ncbi:SDR family NAD(P)-dependent oxidoreductase [Nocardia sp. CA-135398]|uniref:SDR family NAD(P)-dependent oxidoreductase n=1 Tax=Nocardia sp. CA-135398 TaxID=3239977 RepID=UPI003D998BAC
MAINEVFDLSGKVVFVTGAGAGAGAGLGVEFAESAADAGADVVRADINLEGAEQTAESVEKLGRKALAVECDTTSIEQVESAVAQTISVFGKVDVLINNAGIADPVPARLHEYDVDNWRRVLDVDLNGVFNCSKAVLGHMVQAGSGKIINIASMSGLSGSSSVFPIPAYNASKGAVVNLTRELGLQYAADGIQANALCPGFYRTRLAGGAYDDPDFVAAVTAFTPMRRVAKAAEIRGPALFLATSASDYMTGQTLVVDGECLAK